MHLHLLAETWKASWTITQFNTLKNIKTVNSLFKWHDERVFVCFATVWFKTKLTSWSALSLKIKSHSCGFSCYCYFLSKPSQLKAQLWSIASYPLTPLFHSCNSTTANLTEYFSSHWSTLRSLSDHSISWQVYFWTDNYLSLDPEYKNRTWVLLTVFGAHRLL